MSVLEEFGISKIQKYYSRLQQKKQVSSFQTISELFASKHIYFVTFLAFLVGAILTFPIIWLELKYEIFNFEHINLEHIGIYVLALILLVGLEFYLLFLLGFYSIAYHLYHLHFIEEIGEHNLSEDEFLRTFSRTIMELPEPKHHNNTYNIQHHNISNRDIILFSLLYKLKVIVSNFLLKFVARKLLTRSSFRVYTPYIATLGTGIWDAFVLYKSIRYSQHKIVIHYVINQLLAHHKETLSQENNLKAILARYHYLSQYSYNFDYILTTLQEVCPINYTQEEYLEEDVFRNCSPELLVLLFSFKAEFHTGQERKLIATYVDKKRLKTLRKAIKKADLSTISSYLNI